MLYLCDRRACDVCSYPNCQHTENIRHAKNFLQSNDVMIEEIPLCQSAIQERYLMDGLENSAPMTHQTYLEKFARNHGLSIEDAQKHPMVQAHAAYINSLICDKPAIINLDGHQLSEAIRSSTLKKL